MTIQQKTFAVNSTKTPSGNKAGDKVGYGLRFHILPDASAVQRAREVVEFCARHRIGHVQFLFNMEEWNRGHVTEQETRRLTAMFRKIVPLFRKADIGVGLEILANDCERGRSLRAGQHFELMVSPSGKKGKALASFACRHWRKFVAELCGRMAGLGFDVIWLDDDFRFHNHHPLDWGGDFSPAMLKLFSAKIGRKVSRREVVRNVLQAGKPHPWRRLWLSLWRECLEQTAGAIRGAVASSNPNARLGLMSGHPDQLAAEGRNWQALFKAFDTGGGVLHRPSFAHYYDVVNEALFYPYNTLDAQKRFRPSWVESHAEIENFPFSRFNKSDTLTFLQMALAKIAGSEGLLLDLHPFTGSGVFEEEGIGELLDKSHPALDWLGKHFDRDMVGQGAGVPFIPAAPLDRRLKPGATFHDLVGAGGWSEIPGYILGACGIAFQRDFSPAVNAVWGSNAWGLTDEQIRQCLACGLWLDAEAAEIFIARGYGKYLGVKIDGWLEREKSLYALERIAAPETGVRRGLNLSCNLMSRVLRLRSAGAETWTELVDCMDERMGAALSVYRNTFGGMTAVSAFPLAEERTAWNLNFHRQTLAQNLIRALAGRNPPAMALKAPRCLVIDLAGENERRLAAVNLALDPIAPEVVVPRAQKLEAATLILPLQNPRRAPVSARLTGAGLIVSSKIHLPFCGMLVISVR